MKAEEETSPAVSSDKVVSKPRKRKATANVTVTKTKSKKQRGNYGIQSILYCFSIVFI